jgi:glycosyltransferase involved in cell wall biosynthesis
VIFYSDNQQNLTNHKIISNPSKINLFMKIVLTAHSARLGGILYATIPILQTLPKIAPMHQYLIVVPDNSPLKELGNNTSNIEILTCPNISTPKRIFLWDRTSLCRAVRNFKPDWIWSLVMWPVPLQNMRQSIFMRGAYYVYSDHSYSNFISSWQRMRYIFEKYYFSSSLKYVTRVYCQTPVIKKRFVEFYKYPENQVGICPMSTSHFNSLKTDINVPDIIKHYTDKFKLLTLAAMGPNKNHLGIIDLYDKYRDELSNTVCFWTLDEKRNSLVQKYVTDNMCYLLKKVDRLKLNSMIINIGQISPSDVPDYISNVDAMFLPTLLETFCNPYIESMKYQCPIITSDLDFSHPVCGDAALYINPLSLESMKNGILQLASNTELKQMLIENGKKRQTSFIRNWEDILRDVLDQEEIEHL